MKIEEIEGIFEEFEKRVFKLCNGEYVLIEMEGDDTDVYWVDRPSIECEKVDKIGCFEFSFIDDPSGGYFKVMSMDLGQAGKRFLKKGIGTKVIEMKREGGEGAVVFGDISGFGPKDGSHLIDDGPAFVESINRKIENGII